jgi:hypothetical protein
LFFSLSYYLLALADKNCASSQAIRKSYLKDFPCEAKKAVLFLHASQGL